MAFATDHRFDRGLFSIVGAVPRDRSPPVRSDASIDALPLSAILGCHLTRAAPEFSVLRIDIYAQPLFPAGLPLYTNANRARFPASDRFANVDERLLWPSGSQARSAFSNRCRPRHRWSRIFLARVRGPRRRRLRCHFVAITEYRGGRAPH